MRTARVPRVHRGDARPRRGAARPDDLRGDPRGVRLRALRRRRRRRAGATSAIVVDLPVEEHPEVPRIQLVAPTSTDERIALCAARSRRLALSRLADRDDGRAQRGLPRARRARRADARADRLPLYAGFGISTPAHAARSRRSPTASSSARARSRSPRGGRPRSATTSAACARRSTRSANRHPEDRGPPMTSTSW